MKHICVLTGVHRGAVVEVGADPIVIGDGEDCDALLSDASASRSALRIEPDGEDGLVARAVRGAVSRNGRRLRVGSGGALTEGIVVGIGDVELAAGPDLASAERAVLSRGRRASFCRWSAGCALCLALLGASSLVGGSADAYVPSDEAARRSFVPVGHAAREPLLELREELVAAGLADAVSVTRDASGGIVASGALTISERERWKEIVRWFDGRFGAVSALDMRLSPRSDDIVLPFRIVSVQAMPNPRLVIENGAVFPVGSLLPGGWEVRRIERMTVVLAREERELVISF